jgi:hypothetical protein
MPLAAAEPVSADAERAELEAVLASPRFARSPALAHFLSYLCEKKFSGDADRIKEYAIALEVFGRPSSFDQDSDSIVRVQANRLRKRLAEYYGSEGAGHTLQIAIPIGQYVPVFQRVPASRNRRVCSAPQNHHRKDPYSKPVCVAGFCGHRSLRHGRISIRSSSRETGTSSAIDSHPTADSDCRAT